VKQPLALLALLVLSSAAYAGGSTWKDAKVSDITVYAAGGPEGKGYVVVTFAANGAGTPNCASGYPRSVVIDLSTAGGAYAAAIAQSAYLMGSSSLTVTGTGTCTVSPTTETVASVQEMARNQP
jgi:hypothetical protein